MPDADARANALKKSSIPLPAATAIGVAIGLAALLLILRFAPKPAPIKATEPRALAGAPLPEDEGALATVVVNYVARLEPLIAQTYRDYLSTLDPSTKLVVVVPGKSDAGDGDAARAIAFLERLDPSGALAARARVVEAPSPISLWSKDRALVAAPALAMGDAAVVNSASYRSGLLIPVAPDPRWLERSNDWRTPALIAQAMPDAFYVNELPLEFDAGDFAVTSGTIIVDANLFAKNRARGVASPAALRELLTKLFAPQKVVMLGEQDGDVPRHHLSMYMTPVGGGVVLVGDPRAGRAVVGDPFVPGEVSPDTGEALRADFSETMLARFDRAARDLAAAGFKVIRVPTVAFEDKTYFAYTNGVYETRAGRAGALRKTAWVPQYRSDASDVVAKLDAIAKRTYEDLGWETREVAVRAVYPFHGTIGCLTNVLARN